MSLQKENYFQNPTKKTLIIFVLFSMVGLLLCFLAMSDFFTETVFQKQYLMMWALIAMNILMLVKLFRNFHKNKVD